MAEGRTRRITIRAGTKMYRRGGKYPDRAKKDHNVIGLWSTSPDGRGCWSFRKGYGAATEYWYVLAEDVEYPEDFPDEEGYEP